MKPTRARNLQTVLDQTPGFGELAARVEAMVQIQTALQNQWPSLKLEVMSVRDGVLTLRTPGAALAAKARQSEPSMLATLRRIHPQLQSVRFKPRKSGERTPTQPGSDRNREIDEASLEQLQMTATQLDEGPVRDALQRLIRRQLSQ